VASKKKPLYMKIFGAILVKTRGYSLFYVQNKREIVNMMFIEKHSEVSNGIFINYGT
tara:strand:+ start:368 stop:538 length:171 start_codon:yes stop_codon:yes gene_type:complete